MFALKLFLMSVVGGFIGWLTNLIAVKLLFQPLNPVKFPFGLKLQGVLPARKSELAVSIGRIIEKELIKPDEIIKSLISDKDIVKLKTAITENVIKILKDKFPAFLHGFTDKTIKKQLDSFMEKDGDRYIRDMLNKMIINATENLTIARMVEEKIEALDIVAFEAIVTSVVKKELRHIEYIGGVLGFVIGIIQGLILLLL